MNYIMKHCIIVEFKVTRNLCFERNYPDKRHKSHIFLKINLHLTILLDINKILPPLVTNKPFKFRKICSIQVVLSDILYLHLFTVNS